jgi:uncharacterized membrane protein YgaE (UPF0421/DUF939 family)
MKYLLLLLTFPISLILGGWCVSTLFNWFISPLGIDTIGIMHGAGIACILNLFKIGLAGDPNLSMEDTEDTMTTIVGIWIAMLIMVGTGWICTQFM